VQKKLAEKKLSLIVWDCYRPKRAVEDFLQWSKDPAHAEMKAEFYQNSDKEKLFALGYLATRSAHSRGSTIDLGVVPDTLSSAPKADPSQSLKACTLPKGERFEDGAIDFGPGYDCLARSDIKRHCRREGFGQPSNAEGRHAGGRLSSLQQGVVALRTRR